MPEQTFQCPTCHDTGVVWYWEIHPRAGRVERAATCPGWFHDSHWHDCPLVKNASLLDYPLSQRAHLANQVREQKEEVAGFTEAIRLVLKEYADEEGQPRKEGFHENLWETITMFCPGEPGPLADILQGEVHARSA